MPAQTRGEDSVAFRQRPDDAEAMKRLFMQFLRYSDYLALVCLAAMIWLSLSPLPQLPPVPGGDKLHHLAAYATLVFLAVLRRDGLGGILLVAAGAIMLGGFVEVLQPYVNRYGEVADFIANCIGVVIGLGLGSFIRSRTRMVPTR